MAWTPCWPFGVSLSPLSLGIPQRPALHKDLPWIPHRVEILAACSQFSNFLSLPWVPHICVLTSWITIMKEKKHTSFNPFPHISRLRESCELFWLLILHHLRFSVPLANISSWQEKVPRSGVCVLTSAWTSAVIVRIWLLMCPWVTRTFTSGSFPDPDFGLPQKMS